jgi:hypothetical protein
MTTRSTFVERANEEISLAAAPILTADVMRTPFGIDFARFIVSSSSSFFALRGDASIPRGKTFGHHVEQRESRSIAHG